jgi:membrane protein DedA with SNARE-associated domain
MLLAVELFSGLTTSGYLGIILYMVLTGCGFPMPEEVAIIAGGVLSANGQLRWELALGALLIGALLGDCVMYWIGRHFGRRLLDKNKLFNRMITPEREKKMEEMLAKHGVKVLLGARFLVGVRGPMYITAGILKVPFKRFVLADLFCATLVVSLFFGISYVYGAEIAKAINKGEGWLTIIVLTVLVLAGGGALWYHLRRTKLEAKLLKDSPPETALPVQEGQAAADSNTAPPVASTESHSQ